MAEPAFDLIKPHVKNVDDFPVRRTLPSHPHKMVGPFVFFDHLGPATLEPGAPGLQVRPHPHIGLATVTYLFDGAILHRDSLGSVQEIRPGDVNWMTAGAGIVHSERTPEHLRQQGGPMHGIQLWAALPRTHEKTAASFEHHPAATLPTTSGDGWHLRLIVGTGFGLSAPVSHFSPLFYAALELQPGAAFSLEAEHAQRAVYPVDGTTLIDGSPVEEMHMAVLRSPRATTIEAPPGAAGVTRVMLLGGAPLDGDRFIWWNFVASSREAIAEARARWQAREFGQVPGETEWIPLPENRKPPESFS